MQRITIEG